MGKRRFELVLAAVFFLVAMFLLLYSQTGVTGGAVGIVDIPSMSIMFLGLLLLFSAVVLYAGGRGIEGIIEKESLSKLREVMGTIDIAQADDRKRIVLLDESVFEKGGEIKPLTESDRSKLKGFLDHYHKVYIAPEVYAMLPEETKNFLTGNGCKVLNEESVSKRTPASERYFLNSRTVRAAVETNPYFSGKKPESENEANRLADNIMALLPVLNAQGGRKWDPNKARDYKDIFRSESSERIKKLIPNAADRQTITSAKALAEGYEGDSIFICSNRPPVRYATTELKKELRTEDPLLSGRIHYVSLD